MQRLRQYMERKKVSQAALGKRVGVSQPTVWSWLSGQSFPSAKSLKRLSRETGLSIDALLDDRPCRTASKAECHN